MSLSPSLSGRILTLAFLTTLGSSVSAHAIVRAVSAPTAATLDAAQAELLLKFPTRDSALGYIREKAQATAALRPEPGLLDSISKGLNGYFRDQFNRIVDGARYMRDYVGAFGDDENDRLPITCASVELSVLYAFDAKICIDRSFSSMELIQRALKIPANQKLFTRNPDSRMHFYLGYGVGIGGLGASALAESGMYVVNRKFHVRSLEVIPPASEDGSGITEAATSQSGLNVIGGFPVGVQGGIRLESGQFYEPKAPFQYASILVGAGVLEQIRDVHTTLRRLDALD